MRRGLTREIAGVFEGKEDEGAGWGSSKYDKQKQKQIPPLRCGMTNKSGFPSGMTNKEATTEILSLRLRMTSKNRCGDSSLRSE